MAETLDQQVGRWVSGHGRRAEDAMGVTFPKVLDIYHNVLIDEAPAKITRPGDHPYSRNQTWKLYRFLMESRHLAILVNPRPRSLGRSKSSAGDDEDVSGYIDKGYTREGPRKALGFNVRGIKDSFHQHAWRLAQGEIRAYWPDALLREMNRG